MTLRYQLAKAESAVVAWGLKNVARRAGANLPGKLALKIDPQVIAHSRGRLERGSCVIVGTNGKTTVTNLVADCVEAAGMSVACNRTGANLAYGVASALLECRGAQWGVIESDELWLGRTLPQLQANFVVLLNLFRDQLDRCGELDHIQDVIVEALRKSPRTVLLFNADDPLCAAVAARADALPERAGVRSLAFGVAESMGLAQNSVSDTTMCQRCNHMMEYSVRQYGQLGDYACPSCGFARPSLDFVACNVELGAGGAAFDLERCVYADGEGGRVLEKRLQMMRVHTQLSGSYMVYNMLAVAAAAHLLGVDEEATQKAVTAFDPKNGRLQKYEIAGRRTLLNLAKNPTGFNQNLRIILQDAGEGTAGEGDACAAGAQFAVAFFINDRDVDGHDISWIWDIDFEELAAAKNAVVFAGGERKNDLQVRLKYAGIKAQLVDNMADVYAAVAARPGFDAAAPVYAICNYTCLAPVHAELDALQKAGGEGVGFSCSHDARSKAKEVVVAGENSGTPDLPCGGEGVAGGAGVSTVVYTPAQGEPSPTDGASVQAAATPAPAPAPAPAAQPVVIAHLFPDLLNLYGDGGNVTILKRRLEWRGIPVRVQQVHYGQSIDLSTVDLVFLGGGPDRQQRLAADELERMRPQLEAFANSGGVILAICGGYQILGRTWLMGDEEVPGLGILGVETRRPGPSTNRIIDNIALNSPLATHPVVGYENHAGRTYLDAGVQAFGALASNTGHGNNDADRADGALVGNVLGTYLHGCLLSKNPEVADWLLTRALERAAARGGEGAATAPESLLALDDAEELAANALMAHKLGAHAVSAAPGTHAAAASPGAHDAPGTPSPSRAGR